MAEPTPKWVRILGAAFLIFLAVFAAIHIAGGGLGGHLPDAESPQHVPGPP